MGLAHFQGELVTYDYPDDAWALGIVSTLILLKNNQQAFLKIYNLLPSLKCHFEPTYFTRLVQEIKRELERQSHIPQAYVGVIGDGLLVIDRKERLSLIKFMKFLCDFNRGIIHPLIRIRKFSQKIGVIQEVLKIPANQAITEVSSKIITLQHLHEEMKTEIQVDGLNIASLEDLLSLKDLKQYSPDYELNLPRLEPKPKVSHLFALNYQTKEIGYFNTIDLKMSTYRSEIAFNPSGSIFTNLPSGSLISVGGFSSMSSVWSNQSHLHFHVQQFHKLKCTWYQNLPELRICASGVGLTKSAWTLIGGFNQRFKVSIPYSLIFSARNNTWKYAPALSAKRNKPALVAMVYDRADYLFAFGGERETKIIESCLTDSTMESTCEALKVEYFQRRKSGKPEWQILKFNSATKIRNQLSLNNYLAIEAPNSSIILFGNSAKVLVINMKKFNQIRAIVSDEQLDCVPDNIGGYTGANTFSIATNNFSGCLNYVQIDLDSGYFSMIK